MILKSIYAVLFAPWFCLAAFAQTPAVGLMKGVVHDPQHRPIAGAEVTVMRAGTAAGRTQSGADGGFVLERLAPGEYSVTVTAPGFHPLEETATVVPGRAPVLHLAMELAAVGNSITVSSGPENLNAVSSTPQTLVQSREITQTPGADQTNSLAMITDFTPGAYMVHDMLHLRGGHQVNWLIDGIPVINTNIAANVAPLINPKNVESLEVERGGYSSEYGDRTYGFFDVVTPSGFDRDNEVDLTLSGGNFYSTDDQISFGGHTKRLAYFASVDANRSELGLAPPVSQIIHDQDSGVGGFFSLLYNASGKDQLRWVASVREDHYQIPNDPDLQAAGVRDLDLERDYLAGIHWTHDFSDGVTLTVSPYYHFNRSSYVGGPQDTPFILNDNARSNYFGAQAALQVIRKKHHLRSGWSAWGQHDNTFFGLTSNPGGGVLQQQELNWANSEAVFLEDQYAVNRWLTLDLGLRLTHYGGLVAENSADPRVGGSLRLPWLRWTLHGYYAYYYQPPPLDSLAGPSLAFAQQEGFGFIPLRGERDIQHEIGLTIPVSGWSIDFDRFHTSARNFLDHDVIGDSGIFIPLTDLGAITSGNEVSVRSPKLFRVAQWRIAYSNQIAQGVGPITGGLLEDADAGKFLLDHDQRNTLSSVLSLTLPGGWWGTVAYQFGSGFLNGDGPAHLPPHSTFDLSIGRQLAKSLSVAASVINIANTRYLLDTSNTFGGTHYINPRQIYGEIRYRFHY